MVVKLPDECKDLPDGCWSGPCPNCKQQLHVSVSSCANNGKRDPTPVTPSFTFNSPYCDPYTITLPSATDTLRKLEATYRVLSLSGWYYKHLDWQGARSLLKDASVGSFLIRNSGDSNYIFSISVQTDRGPTSVRLHFQEGFFRLDCDRVHSRYMPRFRCALELVQHYRRAQAAGTVWVDRAGVTHSPALLRRPLRRAPPPLMHAARLAVHRALDSNPLKPKLWSAPKHRLLPLPSTLIDYLGQYPYSV